MIDIGIYCPDWMLSRHNTDHKIARMFSRLGEYSEIRTEFVASKKYTLSFNVSRVIQRVTTRVPHLLNHGLRKECDLIYHYGNPLSPDRFYNAMKESSVFVTTGFMTDRYVNNLLGESKDRQKEADVLARTLEKADQIHFHTHGGLHRFLRYRPEFAEKAVAIPFFLPNLSAPEDQIFKDKPNHSVSILFVGNDGRRKGLFELIETLDLIGTAYLDRFNVKVTIVSKDKPKPKNKMNLQWFSRLPHHQVTQLMQEASIFVLIPKSESYGLVLVEAMNAGCAVLTDDDDTRKEIVSDAGMLLSSHSTASMAYALRTLIEDVHLRQDLGEKARKRTKANFLPEVVAQQYRHCFKKMTENKG